MEEEADDQLHRMIDRFIEEDRVGVLKSSTY